MITVGSLFSGIGGLDLGLERAGMKVIWQAEKDDFCSLILKKHWPEVPNLGDVSAIDWNTVSRPDVLAGGFPCQPVSVAGRRRGQEDDRWLWPVYAAAIRHLRPRFAIMENVPGLLIRGMGDVLGDLAQCGYDAEWQVLPASAFGCFHQRERVFIVAYADGERRKASWIFTSRNYEHYRIPQQEGRESGFLSSLDSKERLRPAPDSSFFRVADGFPSELDKARLKACGNSVVPAVAEFVGRSVMESLS